MAAAPQSKLPHSPSKLPVQVAPSLCNRMTPAPAILQNIPTGCPTPNDLIPAHFYYSPHTHTPCSPPSWQMLLTQMNGLLQLQNLQRNIEVHKQNPSFPCPPPYNTSVATPTSNYGYPSGVYPMMHQPNMPFMGYSGSGFEDTFHNGHGQYKLDPLSTGMPNLSHLSIDPTTHHASCKDGYCHHIEEHIKRVKKQRKRKVSTKQEERPPKVCTKCTHTQLFKA